MREKLNFIIISGQDYTESQNRSYKTAILFNFLGEERLSSDPHSITAGHNVSGNSNNICHDVNTSLYKSFASSSLVGTELMPDAPCVCQRSRPSSGSLADSFLHSDSAGWSFY